MDEMHSTLERVTDRVGTTYYGRIVYVTDVGDPDNRCRIQATVPAVLGSVPCDWAMPAAPFAGGGHGLVMLPEVGSAVWIEFEAGQIHQPIWSGGFWANNQRPDPTGAGVRVLVSKKGHKIVVDDDADEIRISHSSDTESLLERITLTGDDITLTFGFCSIKISQDSISLNDGMIKVGPAGVSLVNGAMAFGVPPS